MPRPLRETVASPRSPLRRLVVALGAVVLAAVLAGCQVQLQTTVHVNDDGSGTLTQAIGFDAVALARVGDLSQQVALQDLKAAGWTVDAPVTENGTTWLRIHHPFRNVGEANQLLATLSGPNGPYKDLVVSRDAGLLSTTTKVTGSIDLTGGPAIFGDQALTTALGGDPSGGLIGQIEAAEGKPVSQMFSLQLTVELPGGATQSWQDDFTKTAPVPVEASVSRSHLTTVLWEGFVGLLILLTAAVIGLRIRARYRRRKRMMRSATRRIQL